MLSVEMQSAVAYKITSEDESVLSFKDGKIKADSHRYLTTYEVDELNKTITTLEERDVRTGDVFAPNTVYQIVDQPTVALSVPVALRGYRINPMRGNIEAISFCNGKFNYSKTTEEYINLFYGTYTVDKGGVKPVRETAQEKQ